MNKYMVRCSCGRVTSKSYARKHGGKCKECVEPGSTRPSESAERRNARLIDSGWEAYAREEGHYDLPDWA